MSHVLKPSCATTAQQFAGAPCDTLPSGAGQLLWIPNLQHIDPELVAGRDGLRPEKAVHGLPVSRLMSGVVDGFP